MEPRIQYAKTADGIRIAYSIVVRVSLLCLPRPGAVARDNPTLNVEETAHLPYASSRAETAPASRSLS